MRIAIDFQGAQTGSRFRGIGRYSTELVKALIRNGVDHEFFIMLNAGFPQSIEQIRADFDGLLPQKNIIVWHPVGEPEGFDQKRANRREMSQVIREYALQAVEPDVILITSLFEGPGDPAIVTVKQYLGSVPTAAVFHDFSPLIIPDEHFKHNPLHRYWYRQRIDQLRNCDIIFENSENSRSEVHHFLDFSEENSINIFGGISADFSVRKRDGGYRAKLLDSFNIKKPFLLYAGGLEVNKNLKRLIESLGLLPDEMKRKYELVIIGKRNPGDEEKILSWAVDGLSRQMVNVVGYVSENDLIDLYNFCALFVFPSLREGFGLPAAEAMACGAPTIVSDRTSLPEVVANPDALFDPESSAAISSKIVRVLSDQDFRDSLVKKGLTRARNLSWDKCAQTLLSALQERITPRAPYDSSRRSVVIKTGRFSGKRIRILVTKLDHNGDFVLGLPAMMKLRKRYPDAQIDVVVGSWNHEAVKFLGLFDNIFTLDYFKAKSSDVPKIDENELSDLIDQLPYYDYAIDFRRQPDTRFILVQFPASAYFGYDCGDGRVDALLTNALPRYDESFALHSPYDSFNTSEQILKIIDQLPYAPTDYFGEDAFTGASTSKAGAIGIFPRVGNDARQWPTERFAALIDRLAGNEAVHRINLYGGKVEELNSIPFKSNDKIAFHTGLAFPELLNSVATNQLCVGNNSFGVHLGSYAGCQTVGIYSGHELPQHWGPSYGDAYAITADAPCSPCHLPTRESCPYDLFCLNDITVDTVERVILDALEGRGVHEDHGKITRANPATAIQPLINELINQKHLGHLHDITDDQRVELSAAISINFPDRPSPGRSIYVDVSALLSHTPGVPALTEAKLTSLNALAKSLRGSVSRDDTVMFIAADLHDHEFYAVDARDLPQLSKVISSHDRSNRVIRPLAGDVYVGPDIYTRRNDAQWRLLAAWRLQGVRVAMQAPLITTSPVDCNPNLNTEERASYCYKLAHFDAMIVDPVQLPVVEDWLARFGPPQSRRLELIGGDPLLVTEPDRIFVSALLAEGPEQLGGEDASAERAA